MTLARAEGVLADDAKQLQDRAGGELEAFTRVEPEHLAGQAQVDRDRGPEVALEGRCGHRGAAVGADHTGTRNR